LREEHLGSKSPKERSDVKVPGIKDYDWERGVPANVQEKDEYLLNKGNKDANQHRGSLDVQEKKDEYHPNPRRPSPPGLPPAPENYRQPQDKYDRPATPFRPESGYAPPEDYEVSKIYWARK
jgi:hypothetical protein